MLSLFDRLKLTPSERRLVVVIAAVVFVVLNYWIVWPRFGDFKALSQEMESIEEKRARYQKEVDRRTTYEVLLRKLQAEGSVLPAGEEKIQFRSDMERLARELGLTVRGWGEVVAERSTTTTTNAFFESIALPMNQVMGGEDQIVEFLHRVGASNSTIRVKELTLKPGNFDARAGGRTNLDAVIRLVASVQKAAPKPAPGSPAASGSATNAGAPATTGAARSTPGATNAPSTVTVRTNAIPAPVRSAPRTNALPAGPAPRK
jgi:hypothetical protein